MTTQRVVRDRKFCAKCQKWMHVREFRPNRALSSGLDSWCRSCHRETTKAWRSDNAVALNVRRREAYATNREVERARARLKYALKVRARVAEATRDLEQAMARAA